MDGRPDTQMHNSTDRWSHTEYSGHIKIPGTEIACSNILGIFEHNIDRTHTILPCP